MVEEAKKGAVISYDKIKKYEVHNVLTGSGKRRAVDNNDVVSVALRGLTSAKYNTIRMENEVVIKNWDVLSVGLKRLALGNSLRKLLRHKKKFIVLGKTIEA